MVRIKRGLFRAKHKKIRRLTRGFRTIRRTRIKKGREALLKAGAQAYRHRRTKKREFRRLWILRLNAALRQQGLTYSFFIRALKRNKIELDRKVLAQLASQYPKVFEALVSTIIQQKTLISQAQSPSKRLLSSRH